MRSGRAAKEMEAEPLVQNAGKEINRIYFALGRFWTGRVQMTG